MNLIDKFKDIIDLLEKNNLNLELLQKTLSFPFDKLDSELKKYIVDLENEPSNDLDVFPKLFEKIQQYKNLVIPILNRAVKVNAIRESFKNVLANLKKTEFNRALIEIKTSKLNDEFKTDKLREAKATNMIELINQFYNVCLVLSNESENFVQRVKNIVSNLDSSAQQLSRQLTAVMFMNEIMDPNIKTNKRKGIRLNFVDEEE